MRGAASWVGIPTRYRYIEGGSSSIISHRPIHDAIESGNLDLVKLLLSNGADPLAEIGGRTPLEFALANHQMEVYAFLQCELL